MTDVTQERWAMIYWSFISFAVALTAGLFGFGGSTAASAQLAQTLFFVCLGISVTLVTISFARDGDEARKTE